MFNVGCISLIENNILFRARKRLHIYGYWFSMFVHTYYL